MTQSGLGGWELTSDSRWIVGGGGGSAENTFFSITLYNFQ